MLPPHTICYTLDLESNYGGMITDDDYHLIQDARKLDLFCALIQKRGIKLTTFVTGKILKRREKAISKLQDLGSEFNIHTFSHRTLNNSDFNLQDEKQLKEEVSRAKEAFVYYFGHPPQAYRAAAGVVSQDYLKTIAAAGFKIDSSIFPAWRPGYFQNLKGKTKPYLVPSTDLLEIPFSVIPKIRLVIAQSYIKFFGLPLYKIIAKVCGLPPLIIFDFHLADLFPNPSRLKLPLYMRLYHYRNLKHGFAYFQKVIDYFQKQGYQSQYLSQVYAHYRDHPG